MVGLQHTSIRHLSVLSGNHEHRVLGRLYGHGLLDKYHRTCRRLAHGIVSLKNPAKAGKIADVVRALQECYRGEVYLGWNRGQYSVAIWHQGQWLHASLWGTVEDTLRHVDEAEGEGAIQQVEAALLLDQLTQADFSG